MPPQRTGIRICLLIVFGSLLFSPALWNRDLWNPDEPRYAEVAREMLETGKWLVPHLNGEVYPDKPPLFFWIQALSMRAFGVNTASARLPSVLFGIAVILLTYLIAEAMRADGLLAGIVLATSIEFLWMSQRANIDLTLLFFILASFYLYILSQEKGWCLWLASLMAGLGLLTKGPVVLLVLGSAILPYLLWRKQWREVLNPRWIAVLCIVILVSLVWVFAVSLTEESGYISETIKTHILARLKSSPSHRHSPFYYVLIFPLLFLPWTPYLPQAFALVWRKRYEIVFQAFLWFIVGFILFSLISSKREMYILPLYVPSAIIVASLLKERDGRAGLISVAVFGIIGAGSIVTALCINESISETFRFFIFGAILLLATSVGFVLWHKLGYRLLPGIVLIFTLACSFTLAPGLNKYKSARPLAEFLRRNRIEGTDVLWFRKYEPGVAFYGRYSRMPVTDRLEDLNAMWLITKPRYVRRYEQYFSAYKEAGRFRIGEEFLVVLRKEK